MLKSLSSFQWKILGLVAFITILNFIDRSAISFAIQPIQSTFGLDNAQFGIISAAFGVGYIIMAIFGGILADKFGTIGTWAIAATLWSLATMLMGWGEGFFTFLWLRIFLGLAEGIHFPALLKTVTIWFPKVSRARTVSICLAGAPVASIIGAPLTTHLISAFGWRSMFAILGSIGIFWAIAWLVLFRKHPKFPLPTPPSRNVSSTKSIPWKALLSNHSLLLSLGVYFAFGYTLAFALMWLPGYLQQIHRISILNTGYLVMLPWICSAFFLLFGGWLSDHLMARTGSLRIARSSLIGTGALLSGLCFLAIAFSHQLSTSVLWVTLGIGVIFTLNAPVYTLIADLFTSYAGVVQGLHSAVFSMALILSPLVTGWLTQITGSFRISFFLVATLSIFTATLLLLFHRPDRKNQRLA